MPLPHIPHALSDGYILEKMLLSQCTLVCYCRVSWLCIPHPSVIVGSLTNAQDYACYCRFSQQCWGYAHLFVIVGPLFCVVGHACYCRVICRRCCFSTTGKSRCCRCWCIIVGSLINTSVCCCEVTAGCRAAAARACYCRGLIHAGPHTSACSRVSQERTRRRLCSVTEGTRGWC